jgi:pSer/pThr/pTyr-binding forkhead associated (FHA) protein
METKRMTGFIEVLKGMSKGRKFQVLGDTSIGRSPECGVSLPDSQVSRKHCSLVVEGDRFILVHESKTSTTKVGRNVVRSRHPLQDEEEITLADRVVLRWKKN